MKGGYITVTVQYIPTATAININFKDEKCVKKLSN